MAASTDFTKVNDNIQSLTEIRAAAKDLLKFLTSPSVDDLSNAASVISGGRTSSGAAVVTSGEIMTKLLSSAEAVPLYDMLAIEMPDYFTDDNEEIKTRYVENLVPGLASVENKGISLIYHGAQSRVDIASALTDISAVFCNLIPSIEMSLCVPYFDVKVLYPNIGGLGRLSTLRFVGAKSTQEGNTQEGYVSSETGRVGIDVAGMEIFCMPQTLVASSEYMNSPDALSERGVAILDPLVPLLTIESAGIQQTGVGGSLYAQTKVDLKLILHDRSRLSEIEPIVSAEIFPTVTFRITYGWSHPDTNKMTGGVYAKLLNSMRVTQDFALSSVSVGTRDATSLSISLSLISLGSAVAKGANVVTSAGELVPYSVIQTLARQFVTIKEKKKEAGSSSFEISKVGASIIASTSAGTNTNKFITLHNFYNLRESILETIGSKTDTSEKLAEIAKSLETTASGSVDYNAEAFERIFDFRAPGVTSAFSYASGIAPFDYGIQFGSDLVTTSAGMLSSTLLTRLAAIISDNGLSPSLEIPDDYLTGGSIKTEAVPMVVPLSAAIARFVAKPLLLTNPDIDEVRIHCFSFNSSCGVMAEENIGNFPIMISDIKPVVKDGKIASGFTQRTTAESALSQLLKFVNNPSSLFYGLSAAAATRDKAVAALKASVTGEETEAENQKIDTELQGIYEKWEQEVSKLNSQYLAEKGIGSVDAAFTPPRVKGQIEVVPAYDSNGSPTSPNKTIARILIYDDRTGGFNKTANLVFSMINNNGIAMVGGGIDPLVGASKDLESIFTNVLSTEDADSAVPIKSYALRDKLAYRKLATQMYPNLIVGTEGTNIVNATYTSQPAGDLQSSYLLTALQGSGTTTTVGASVGGSMVDDVLIVPANVNVNMIGNVCISRGQTYYIDFNTGTSLDNSYTVQSVSHNIRPGSFTTSVAFMPTNSASIRSTRRQIQELALIVKNKAGLQVDSGKSSTEATTNGLT